MALLGDHSAPTNAHQPRSEHCWLYDKGGLGGSRRASFVETLRIRVNLDSEGRHQDVTYRVLYA